MCLSITWCDVVWISVANLKFIFQIRKDTTPLRRAGQPTPVFLPEESHGQRILAGYSPWGHKESDTTEATEHPGMHHLCITELLRESTFSMEGVRNWGRSHRPRLGAGIRNNVRCCVVRPLSMAVLLLSVRPLPGWCLLHLQSARITDLPKRLPQAPC